MADESGLTGAEGPRILADVRQLLADPEGATGARWALNEPGRQLDANVIHVPVGGRIGTHTEPDLDVLVLVVAGDGVIKTPAGQTQVAEGNLLWLPAGSTRGIAAGDRGLSYLTVHRRRPGLQIKPGPGSARGPEGIS